MIKLCSVGKSYSKLTVFDGLSLQFEKGKTTCILGESGSGKTTLLNIIAGLTDYTGTVVSNDCSYVFQTPNLFPNLTALDNLKLVCKDQKKIIDLCEKLKISDKLGAYPTHLSGGQAQRVALARGVLFDTETLLMDEPFSSLDLKIKMQIIELLKKEFAQSSRTVVMVTHDIKEAVSMADRIVVLSSGKVVEDISEVNENTEKQLFGVLMNCGKEN